MEGTMNIVLGVHVKHDRSACIIIDGKVVVNIANERLDRVKYSDSPEIPYTAVDAVLKHCNIDISQVSCIGMSGAGIESEKVKQFYKDDFFAHYRCREIPFFFLSHHWAHAYSSFCSSTFSESLIFVADGGGDYIGDKQEAETLYYGSHGKIQPLAARTQDMVVRKMENPVNTIYPFMPDYVRNHQISIARKYAQITHLTGFAHGECGKTMGLASYGKSYFDYSQLDFRDLDFDLKYKDMLEVFYALHIMSGKSHRDFILKERANISATVQEFTECAIISLLKNYQTRYSCENLCLAGGLFLICLLNHKILCECNFKNVFIIPSAGDDGQALGSAYYAYMEMFGTQSDFHINLPYIGLDYTEQEIEDAIRLKNLSYKKYADGDLAKITAEYISQNKIVGMHRGRTELGPRALCHRSILANPTHPYMKDILNRRVKHREEFRPFAPTVAKEDQFKYFALRASSDYMLLAPVVREEYREKLSAVTHVDNTARVQAVSKKSDPFIHQLLLELKKVIGVSVVLNTSFNVAGEPIVESPQDALNTFLKTNIDVLVIGNCVVTKP